MIALYPGAFKPPHRGHFNVVKSLLDGSYNGTVYTKDDYQDKASSLFQGNSNDKPKIDKVIIFIGGGERNGIDKQEATAIWEIYSKHLGSVEIVDGQKNPMFAAKDYARENPNEEFVAVTGIRGEKDFVDLKRVTTFNNVDNVQGLALASKPGSGIRATDFRNNILSGNLDKISDFFPEELSSQEVLSILTDLKDKIVSEILSLNIEGFVEGYFTEENRYNKDGYDEGDIRLMGDMILPTGKMVVLQAEEDTYNRGLLVTSNEDKSYDVAYWADDKTKPYPIGIEIDGKEVAKDATIVKFMFHPEMKEEVGETKPEYTKYIASILEYMLDQNMNIQPLPEVKVRYDEENAKDFFGKTAYYSPGEKEIVLYATGRHPKDICRSFTHEMIHHIQNLEGRLSKVNTTNTTEDDNLLNLEKEAYLLGNITFRNWEDSYKNKSTINEGKYDTLSNKLSKIAFEFFKDVHDRGDKEGEFEFRVGNPEYDDVDIESNQFEFDFMGIVKYTDDTYKVDGGANAGYDDDGEEIQPMINVKFMIPRNPDWQEVSMDLKDVVRHELEHLTQDGENLRQGKYIPDDQDLRALIDKGLLDKDMYFTLQKEVDAMIQGLYFKAKKSRKPFSDVVDDYLKKALNSLENREKVRILWNKRLPTLGIKQRL